MPEAYHGRGNAYSQRDKADRAMADLEKVLRLSPALAAGETLNKCLSNTYGIYGAVLR